MLDSLYEGDLVQLSDNISLLLPHPLSFSVATIPEPTDPTFYYDLKAHLDSNVDYRKSRIEWRKNKPAYWDMYRIKDEFFKEFCEKDLPTFHQDVFYFMRVHPDLSAEEGAEAFCKRWRGYETTYGKEFVRRAIARCGLCHSK